MRRPFLSSVALLLASLLPVSPARAEERLFPEPLHLKRVITDSGSGTVVTVDEYCEGNQVVTVSGTYTVIVDFQRQQRTDIDRKAGEWSVASFHELAKAFEPYGAPALREDETTATNGLSVHSLGISSSSSSSSSRRMVESFEFGDSDKEKVRVSFDRSVELSSGALEVLLGAAYPNRRTALHDAVVRTARSTHAGRDRMRSQSVGEAECALPVEQRVTTRIGADEVTITNVVVAMTSDVVPPDVIRIPSDARQVQSHIVATAQMLRELDELPRTGQK